MKGRELSGRAVIKLLRQIGYKPNQNVRAIWKGALDREVANFAVLELERLYNLKERK